MESSRRGRTAELDRRLVGIAKGIRVLGELSWSVEVMDAFLAGWRRGQPRLPEVRYARSLHHAEVEALAALRQDLDPSDPVHRFLDDTAGSYRAAARMLETNGTPEFLELSQALYGTPTDRLPGSKLTHLDAADQLLASTDALADAGLDADAGVTISSEIAAERMRERLGGFFTQHTVEVVVDAQLGAKATAGARRVRLRGNTQFSELDLEQLVEHEAFVHSATALNGREQPVLSVLGLGSPRTTLTQEGLATVAELATRAIDIARLRRIALRIRAIHIAMQGADFIDVFRFFLERGQSEEESVRSAMRVFRGGDVRGRWVFTKDVVYLQGMIAVHTFLRKAIATHKPFLIERLFAGRMALSDVFLLEDAFTDGLVIAPRYVPGWARNVRALAAYLAFTAVANRIDLGAIELEEILPASDFD
ncbi:MAG: flavohemoglobin expression-modulating QEGLA motif protein [Myxococcota bacterium]|nr:flavohemoglobin expression-modulating QEGLA motif protein [Myxococcota bacterium]